MCVLSIKEPIRKKSGNLFNDPRISNSHWGGAYPAGGSWEYFGGVYNILERLV